MGFSQGSRRCKRAIATKGRKRIALQRICFSFAIYRFKLFAFGLFVRYARYGLAFYFEHSIVGLRAFAQRAIEKTPAAPIFQSAEMLAVAASFMCYCGLVKSF